MVAAVDGPRRREAVGECTIDFHLSGVGGAVQEPQKASRRFTLGRVSRQDRKSATLHSRPCVRVGDTVERARGRGYG